MWWGPVAGGTPQALFPREVGGPAPNTGGHPLPRGQAPRAPTAGARHGPRHLPPPLAAWVQRRAQPGPPLCCSPAPPAGPAPSQPLGRARWKMDGQGRSSAAARSGGGRGVVVNARRLPACPGCSHPAIRDTRSLPGPRSFAAPSRPPPPTRHCRSPGALCLMPRASPALPWRAPAPIHSLPCPSARPPPRGRCQPPPVPSRLYRSRSRPARVLACSVLPSSLGPSPHPALVPALTFSDATARRPQPCCGCWRGSMPGLARGLRQGGARWASWARSRPAGWLPRALGYHRENAVVNNPQRRLWLRLCLSPGCLNNWDQDPRRSRSVRLPSKCWGAFGDQGAQ